MVAYGFIGLFKRGSQVSRRVIYPFVRNTYSKSDEGLSPHVVYRVIHHGRLLGDGLDAASMHHPR